MKLFSLRLTTLKSKLYAIVFASFVVRVVAFFALPNTPASWAPDEETYAGLISGIFANRPSDAYSGYSTELYLSSRALTFPGSILYRLGFSGLDSARITSNIYSIVALILIVHLVGRHSEANIHSIHRQKFSEKSKLIFFIVFSFFPSHFYWSILGLREATLEFWVLATFGFIFYIFEIKKSQSKLAFLGILLAIPLVFSSRPQVGWVLGVTLLIYLFIKVKVKSAQILIPVTIIGILSGHIATTVLSVEKTEVFVAYVEITEPSPSAIPSTTLQPTPKPSKSKQTTSLPATTTSSPSTTTQAEFDASSPTTTSSPSTTTQAEFDASLRCKSEGEEVSIGELKYICSKESEKKSIIGLKNPGKVILDEADAIPLRNELNKIDAASVIETQTCPNAGNSRFDKYFCIIFRAPYTTFTFLFRPMLGSDVTSSSSLFAAIENVFWFASALFVMIMFMRNRRLAFFGALTPSLLFFTIYTIGAGAYEGNMGSAFRHKSLILWVVILLVASTIVATKKRKAENKELIS